MIYKTHDNIVDKRCKLFISASTDAYLDEITRYAHRLREASLDRHSADSEGRGIANVGFQTGLLHGPRGVGKTFYLNHIVSKYLDYLDRKKVLWVRINFLNYYGAAITSETLREWLFAQLTKIIFRYYDSHLRFYKKGRFSSSIDCYKIIQDYIDYSVIDPQVKLFYKEKLQGLVDVFQNSAHMERINQKGYVPLNIGRNT